MALSRKHYVLIANAIKYNTIYSNNSTRKIIKKDALIGDLIDIFTNDNSLFDWRKFDDACNM